MAYYILANGMAYGPFRQKSVPNKWSSYLTRNVELPERLINLSAHHYAIYRLRLRNDGDYSIVDHNAIQHVTNERIDVRPKPTPEQIARREKRLAKKYGFAANKAETLEDDCAFLNCILDR